MQLIDPTFGQLTATGMPDGVAYRVMAELAEGASLSTALDKALTHSLAERGPIYGGLYLPPEAYNADGTLRVARSCTCVQG